MGVFFEPTAGDATVGRLNRSSVVWAAILLIVFAAVGLIAESIKMPVSTENLWVAFQTMLGVIVGFLGGEAVGRTKA